MCYFNGDRYTETPFIWLIDRGRGAAKYRQRLDHSTMSKEDGSSSSSLSPQSQYCTYETEEWAKGAVFYDGQHRYMEANSYGPSTGTLIDSFSFNEGGVGYTDEWF